MKREVTGKRKKGKGERGRGKGKAARWRANVFTDLWHEGWQKAVTEDVTGEKL